MIRPRDPLVVRDARPFSSDPGAHAFTLPWPMPRTVAGAVRTLIGDALAQGADWTAERARLVRQAAIHGPLMVARQTDRDPWHIFVPAPRDVVFYRDESHPDGRHGLQAMVLRPVSPPDGAGISGVPAPELATGQNGFEKARQNAIIHPLSVTREVKPETNVPAWWSQQDAMAWLSHEPDDPGAVLPLERDAAGIGQARGLRVPVKDTRTHVSIQPGSGTNVDGALFTTESLVFPDGYVQTTLLEQTPAPPPHHLAMLCRVLDAPGGWEAGDSVVPLGGERRMAAISPAGPDDIAWPPCPDPPPGWEGARGLRLQLVTPAIFTYGWLPEWLANATIPGLRGSKLGITLVGAAVDRRQPVSGWRLADPPGPRATQYTVPAGSVYFFRVTRGSLTPDIWRKLWFAAVSDHKLDRDQGFGLVLPGIWNASAFAHLDQPATAQEDVTP